MTAVTEIKQDKHPIVKLREQLTMRAADLRNALPDYISPEKFTSAVLTAVQLNPDLLAVDRASLWNACMRCAADGLVPDGREAALVVFKTKDKGEIAQYLPMIGGLLKRFRNSGEFRAVTTNVVRQGEEFSHWTDEHGEHLRHVPGDGEGKIIKAYAVANLKGGFPMIKVMSVADIERRRASSRAKDGPMWREWWDEAAMKTVLRNLSKRLPMSSGLDQMMRQTDEEFDLDEQPAEQPKRIADVGLALDHFAGESAAGAEHEATPAADLKANLQDSVAYEAGKKARRDGLARRAVPGEYRTDEATHLAKMWVQGWDAEDSVSKL